MTSSRSLGVSFLKSRIQIAEVDHGRNAQVLTLAERESSVDFIQAGVNLSANHPQLRTFVTELGGLLKQHKVGAGLISFALPSDPAFINIIPIDASLKGPDLSQYLHWELGQYFPDASQKDFIVSSQSLPATNNHVKQAFVVGVRRGMVAFLQKAAAELKLKLELIDIDHFTTEKALLENYPEVTKRPVVLFGIRYGAVDASLVRDGMMVDYRVFAGDAPGDKKKMIQRYLKYLAEKDESKPDAMFLYGIDVPPDMPKSLYKETGVQCVALNALRKLQPSSKIYKPFLQESHRFAPAIGLALRKT